jgi:hypothetical protein
MTQYQFNQDEFDLITSYTSMTSTEELLIYHADYSMEPNSCTLPGSENQIQVEISPVNLANYYQEIDRQRAKLKAAFARGESHANSCPGLLD